MTLPEITSPRPHASPIHTSARLPVLLWHWGRRGAGSYITLEMARALSARDDLDVHLSISRDGELYTELAALNLPTFAVDTYHSRITAAMASLRLPMIYPRFLDFLISHRIAAVYCTMTHVWNAAMLEAIRQTGAVFVHTLHDAVLHPGEESRVRTLLARREIAAADTVITPSRHVQDQLCARYGYPRDRVRTVPLGVFTHGAAGAAARQLPREGKIRLLFFGRLLAYKGLSLLLNAMPELAEACPQVELAVIGPGDISQYRHALAGLPNVAVDNRWIPESEIGSIFAAADIVVAPYIEASQSGVVPIALGAGVPVVATPVGGLTEQVRHGVTGVIAERADAAALTAAIRRMIEESGLYERCSAAALAETRTTLSWQAIGDQVAGILHDVTRARKHR